MKRQHKKDLLKVNNQSIKTRLASNQLKANVFTHTATSQLICIVNKLTGFYAMRNIGLNEVTNYFTKQIPV